MVCGCNHPPDRSDAGNPERAGGRLLETQRPIRYATCWDARAVRQALRRAREANSVLDDLPISATAKVDKIFRATSCFIARNCPLTYSLKCCW